MMIKDNSDNKQSEKYGDDDVRNEEEKTDLLSPEEWPKTVDEAVNKLLNWLSEEDKENVLRFGAAGFHFGLGMTIRNEFGLWRDNNELIKDCALRSGYEKKFVDGANGGFFMHPDTASGVILDALEEKLQNIKDKAKKD